MTRPVLLVAAAALAAVAAGCGTADDALPEVVADDILLRSGLVVDVRCEGADGAPEVSSNDGSRFVCTATSDELDGSLTVTGVVTLGGESVDLRIADGSGALGERAGFA